MGDPRKELLEKLEQRKQSLAEWEHMSDATAEQLNNWLASSRSLIPSARARMITPPRLTINKPN